MLWHGDGRFDWNTVYNMPIMIRRHWIKRINKLVTEKQEYDQQMIEFQMKLAGHKKVNR